MKKDVYTFRLMLPVFALLFVVSAVSATAQHVQKTAIDKLIRVPICRQSTGYTCGVSCLQSVLYYYYSADPQLRWVREDKLAQELGTTGDGTHYANIAKVAEAKGLKAETHLNMKLDELKKALDDRKPVICAIQAWRDKPTGYRDDEEDGHYVVAIGYDEDNIYFMDPSTLGNYTFIPTKEFPERWHDVDTDHVTKVVGLGIVLSKDAPPTYDPSEIRLLE